MHDADLQLNTGSDFLVDTLAAQWGSAAVTQTNDLYILGVTPIASVRDLNSQIPSEPEFGAYVLNPLKGNSGTSNTLKQPEAGRDFNRDVLTYTTLLNLDTMQSLYKAYAENNTDLMSTRFGLNSQE